MEHLTEDQLWEYISETAAEAEIQDMEEHLANCNSCQEEYLLLQQVEAGLQAQEDDVPSMGFSAAVIQKINAEMAVERAQQFWIRFTKNAIIMAFAVAIILTLIFALGNSISLPVKDENLRNTFGILLMFSMLLWGFYLLDRVFRKYIKPG